LIEFCAFETFSELPGYVLCAQRPTSGHANKNLGFVRLLPSSQINGQLLKLI
jgi:hypothetical protein